MRRKGFISFCRRPDVAINCHPRFVITREITDQTTASAHNLKAHQFRILLPFPETAHNSLGVFLRACTDHVRITRRHIGGVAMPKNVLNNKIARDCPERPREFFTDGKDALMDAVFIRETFSGYGFPVIDVHNIHGSVADVAQHIDAFEIAERIRDSGKALRENVGADEIDVIFHAPESEIRALILILKFNALIEF